MVMTPVELVLQYIKLPFEGKLHKYQEDDINRACLETSFGFYLDLGLGKTICAAITGAYKLLTQGYYSCYVLCPASLTNQWLEVLTKMNLKATIYGGPPKVRAKIDRDVDFLIMSPQIFQKDYDILEKDKIYFIVDEGTVLSNPQNLLFKMINGGLVEKKKKIPGQLMPELTRIVYPNINKGISILTATPINTPINAYGLIKSINPSLYDNYSQFYRVHVEGEDYFHNPNEFKHLDLLRRNLLLSATRRLTTDHLDLPEVVFKTIQYELDPKHQALYDKLLNERYIEMEGEEQIDALGASSLYNWSQKIVFNPEYMGYKKDPVGVEILDGLEKAVKKYLIFANYKMTNTKIMERYKIGGVYGDITAKKQQEYIKMFKEGALKGLTANPKSGGVGLDLPMCQHVFFPELPITPRDMMQCVGRCHRQGQKETVFVTLTVAKKTIQETLFKRLMEKDDVMRSVVRAAGALSDDLLANIVKDKPKTREQVFKELRGEV